MAVRLTGRVPGERECAGLRIQRLECEAVRMLEETGRQRRRATDPGLPMPERLAAWAAKMGLEAGYCEAMDEIEALTLTYFDNNGAPRPHTEG